MVANALSNLSGVEASATRSSTLSDCAAICAALSWEIRPRSDGFIRMATRLRLGTISVSSCSRLLVRSPVRILIPVTLPPGLLKLATSPFATASPLAAMTIGTVCVAIFAARAGAHNIELSIHQVAKGEEVATAIDAAKASGATALNVSASPLFFTHRQLILDRVAALRLPAIYEWPETAEEGGFAAYGPRLDQLFLEVMIQQLVKLFRGIKVADIPVEQPTKLELVINLNTAKALGLEIPESFLVRADEVIE